MSDVSRQLADYFAATRYEDLPEYVVHAARRCIVDGLGCGLGGADHPSVDLLLQYANSIGTRPDSQVWGRKDRLPAPLAALINGHAEHVLDFDDTYLPKETVLHPTVPLLPAIFALAEARHLNGTEALRSFVLGFEMMARLANALGAEHYLAGWHVTATTGPVGSAVACAALLGLNSQQILNAMGIGVTQAGGVTAMLGSMSKAFHAGKAAEAGVRSALLSEIGFDSSPEPLNHPQGYLNVAASDKALDRLMGGLGERWIILENGFKPYASGVVSHPVIDAMAAFKAEGITADQVSKVVAIVNPFVLQVTGQIEPKTGLEGKFSSYHCAAVGLIDGMAAKAQFTTERVLDDEVVTLRRKVTLTPSDEMAKDECRVTITLNDGSTREQYIAHASGTAENPVSDDAMSAKFISLASPVLGEETQRVLDRLWRLDSEPDLAVLIGRLTVS